MSMSRDEYRNQCALDMRRAISEYMLASGKFFDPELTQYHISHEDIDHMMRYMPDEFIRDVMKSVATRKMYQCDNCQQRHNVFDMHEVIHDNPFSQGICQACYTAKQVSNTLESQAQVIIQV